MKTQNVMIFKIKYKNHKLCSQKNYMMNIK